MDPKEPIIRFNRLSLLSAELTTWPENQFCVVENRFEESDKNPSEFVGICNGFLNEYELEQIHGALSLCDPRISPINSDEPLIISAKLQSINKAEGNKSTVLCMNCGVFNGGMYALFASGFENNGHVTSHLSSRKDGKILSRDEDIKVQELFGVVYEIMKYRMNRISKVSFKIGG